jgi:hypothetical protein
VPGAGGIREEFDSNIAGGEEAIFLGELDGAGEVLCFISLLVGCFVEQRVRFCE